MKIASRLKKENICEYLLYMWQLEDLLRALQLDMDLIDKMLLQNQIYKDDAERKEIYDWYDSLVDMMRMEGVQEKGHLQMNQNIIIELNDFHVLMMKGGSVPAYNAKFLYVLPLIHQFRMKELSAASEIEQCFNFQYAYMLLKMKKAEITPETQQSQVEISKFMVLLAKNFRDYKNGDLDLDESL